MKKITCDQAVRALKEIRTSTSAKTVAILLGTSSRAVATALRQAVNDGRVTMRFIDGLVFYMFVRLSKTARAPKSDGGGAA